MKTKDMLESLDRQIDELEEKTEEQNQIFRENMEKLEQLREIVPIRLSGGPIKRLIQRLFWLSMGDVINPLIIQQNQINMHLANIENDLSRLIFLQNEKTFRKAEIETWRKANDGSFMTPMKYNSYSMEDLWKLRDMLSHPIFQKERTERCVIQIVASLNFGDAVGNDALAIKMVLKESGYLTAIFAETIHEKVTIEDAFSLDMLPQLKKDDVVIYHFASADPFAEHIKDLSCKIVLRYHNITPPEFFRGFDYRAEKATEEGLKQIRGLAKYVDYGMIVSEYNIDNLRDMGYECPMAVVPILIPFSDYEQRPNENVIKKYSDGKTNILFVGRGAPNKKIEDIIRCFAVYKKQYDSTARLFLVGNYDTKGKYYKYVCSVIEKENVKDVIFPGHISFTEILAYYKVANVFLCMSEHEGFCVPLVEAMFFHVPIIAYASSAIPDTLGGTGILVECKEYLSVAEKINSLIEKKMQRDEIVEKQNSRLRDFEYEVIKKSMIDFIKRIEGSEKL